MFYDISIKFNYVIHKLIPITLHKSVQLIQKNIIETRQKTIWYSPYYIPLFVVNVDLYNYKKSISIQPYQFRNIQILNLSGCNQPEMKSSDICKLINLTSLDLSGCNQPEMKSNDM